MREEIEPAEARGLLALLDRELTAELAHEAPLAHPYRQLARDEQEIAGPDEGHIVAGDLAGLRQLDAELSKACLDPTRHGASSPGARGSREHSGATGSDPGCPESAAMLR